MRAFLPFVLVLLFALPALANDHPPEDTVPSWVFYWIFGIVTVAGGSLVTAIGVLFRRATTGYDAALATERKAMRDACTKELEIQKSQTEQWRLKFEQSEQERRQDLEKVRQEERKSMKASMQTFMEVMAALDRNTQAMEEVLQGQEEYEENGEE